MTLPFDLGFLQNYLWGSFGPRAGYSYAAVNAPGFEPRRIEGVPIVTQDPSLADATALRSSLFWLGDSSVAGL